MAEAGRVTDVGDRPVGVLLIQLGTPDAPRSREVRRYLREFLNDPRVIDLPAPARWLLVNGIILPTRPRKSAEAYAKIWSSEGSPLRVHAEALRDRLGEELGSGYAVELGMRYGRTAIRDALERLVGRGAAPILALPLFPQYATSTTGSALAALFDAVGALRDPPAVRALGPFYDDPGFLEAHASIAAPGLDAFRPDYVLFSYHGLPERQIRRGDRSGRHCLAREDCCATIGPANRDCYRAQCFATTRALADRLGLETARHGTAFQSRLGRARWIRPYTEDRLAQLAESGVKRLAVLSPAFVADCLETLEELGMRAAEQWQELSGGELRLIPSLNAHPLWVRAVAGMIRRAEEQA